MSNQARHESAPAPQRGLWPWWTLASLIGTTLGGALSLILRGTDFPPSFWQQELIWLGCGALAGLITGLPQWALLRRTIPEPGWWVVVTTLGQAIGWAVLHPLALILSRQLPLSLMTVGPSLIWNTLLAMIFAAAVPGLSLFLVWGAQWYALRAYVARAPWLRAGAICALATWGLAVLVAQVANHSTFWSILSHLFGNFGWWMAFYLAGAIGSGVGGSVVLTRILRRHERQEIPQPRTPSATIAPFKIPRTEGV
jgi:hypothetical protein